MTSALAGAVNITLYRGHARLLSPREVETGAERVRADLNSSTSAGGRGYPNCRAVEPSYNLVVTLGESVTEARKSGRRALVGERPMTRVARAIERGETQGFMRILVDGDSKEILGATLVGTGCDEAVHAVLDLIYAKAPYTVMQRAMHIHPTVSELLPTILGDLKPLD